MRDSSLRPIAELAARFRIALGFAALFVLFGGWTWAVGKWWGPEAIDAVAVVSVEGERSPPRGVEVAADRSCAARGEPMLRPARARVR